MIYLDNAATTKPKLEVIDTITDVLMNNWGNPSSMYRLGQTANELLMQSRNKIADFINSDPDEIIFTSGACEANSLALCGFIKAHPNTLLITSSIEHKSIMDLAKNHNALFVPIDEKGNLELDVLECMCVTALEDNLIPLVSIQWANNEIGTIQNIKESSKIVHKYNGVLHTDATQMIANSPIDVKYVDMLSFSGQKIGAPKGIGVLFKRKNITLSPIIYGTQENSLRGGTENLAFIASLTTALKIIEYPDSKIRDYFESTLKNTLDDIYIIGNQKDRLNGISSVCFRGIEAESLLLLLDMEDIFVSSGSACNSKLIEPSHVLTSIGVPQEDLSCVVRFSFDNHLSFPMIDEIIPKIEDFVIGLRSLN